MQAVIVLVSVVAAIASSVVAYSLWMRAYWNRRFKEQTHNLHDAVERLHVISDRNQSLVDSASNAVQSLHKRFKEETHNLHDAVQSLNAMSDRSQLVVAKTLREHISRWETQVVRSFQEELSRALSAQNAELRHFVVEQNDKIRSAVLERTRALEPERGNVSGSTIGAIGSARDITLFASNVDASSLDDKFKHELKEARHELERLSLATEDKDDVAESLTKLANELQKPRPEQDDSRLKRYLARIKEITPTVASALSITASVMKMSGH
jgi:hypothetical protein